jgi:hypothetical protein
MNDTRYSDCREYVSQSTLRFDNPDETGGAAASKAPLQPLPPRTRLLIGLSKPVNTETAAAGDAVEGVLLRDAIDTRLVTVARTNDRVHGRILRLQQYLDAPPRWVVAIRFDTIERNGMERPMALTPVDDGDRSVQGLHGSLPPGVLQRPAGAGVFFFNGYGNIVLDQNFHSEWETR